MRRVRITDFYKKSSLETVLCWSFFAVSAFLLFLSMGITMYYDIAKERREVDAAISDTAAYVATMPEVAGMLEKGYPDEAARRELDFFCSNSSTLNLMVICDSDGLRFYHTDRNTTGETVTGGDEADILAGSPPYITTGYGSMGMQRRAFHSVRDSQGEIIGYVMASVFTDYLSDRQTNIVTLYLSVLGLMLVMSFLLSRALVVFLRGRLMGHEPEELLDIYIRQDAVLNSLSEGLVAVDPTGTVLYANESAAGFFRVSGSPDSLEGKAVGSLLPDLGRFWPPTGAEVPGDLSLVSAVDGHTLLIKAIPVTGKDSREGMLLVLNDRTELLHMSDELSGTREALDALRAFNHEFKNKLHVILGYLQTGEIRRAMSFIVNSSLVSSRAVQDTAECIRVPSLCALIIGKMMHAAELGITLSLDPDSSCLEPDLLLPKEDLLTVIGNLLENAIEELADPANAEREEKCVRLSIHCRRDFNMIVCEDTGRGMRPELAARVFERGVTTKGENRGFGLHLVNSIVAQNGGECVIDTEVGEGTIITLTFTREESGACIR